MKLDQLYSLRRNFTIIGLTGRTGSGCTTIAQLLSGTFEDLEQKRLRNPEDFEDKVFSRKYKICKNYLSHPGNWTRFQTIKYVNVLLFFIVHRYGGNIEQTQELLSKFFRNDRHDDNSERVGKVIEKIRFIHKKYRKLIVRVKKLPQFSELRSEGDLLDLNELFFEVAYNSLVGDMLEALESEGYYRTRVMLHRVACNIRATGDPLKDSLGSVDHVYSIANLINKLIKARRAFNRKSNSPTKIVIDSLRNSLEIMYFKQRFSAFYMIVTKDVLRNAESRVNKRLELKIQDSTERKTTVTDLMALDAIEYRTKDFSRGTFSSPDVEIAFKRATIIFLT